MDVIRDSADYLELVLGAVGQVNRTPRPVGDWTSWWDERAAEDPAAALTGFVLTTTEVLARGVSRAQQRTAVRHGRWQRPRPGLVAPVDVGRDLPATGEDFVLARRRHALVASATSRLRPSDAIAGRSAAVLHGLPTVAVPGPAEMLAVRGDGVRPGAHLYSAALRPIETATWFGRPVTDVPRTLVDLGRHDRYDAIMAADAALREGLTDPREIERSLARSRGWPGVRQARAVLALADPRAESPLESITRLRLHQDGFPPPQLQAWVGPFRVDFLWPDRGLVLEADGRLKYTSDERWAEKRREQELRRLGVRRVERVIWSDVFGAWRATSVRLRDALTP